jgi:DNA-3-methyladenine glycosylase I
MLEYHDREWGVPVHEDRKHFEFLVLEAAQAGLSGSIVRDNTRGKEVISLIKALL